MGSLKFWAVLLLAIGCASPVGYPEADAGIDELPTEAPTQPEHVPPKPPEPDPCGVNSMKGGVPIPVECQQGVERLEEIRNMVDPAPEVMARSE